LHRYTYIIIGIIKFLIQIYIIKTLIITTNIKVCLNFEVDLWGFEGVDKWGFERMCDVVCIEGCYSELVRKVY